VVYGLRNARDSKIGLESHLEAIPRSLVVSTVQGSEPLSSCIAFTGVREMSRWIVFPLLGLVCLVARGEEDGQEENRAKERAPSKQVLRKKFAAARVAYDSTSGVLTLRYDFLRKEQLNDWELPRTPLQPAQRLRGIRIAPEEILKHRAVFEQASCRFQFAVGALHNRGRLISVGEEGDAVMVRHRESHGRVFEIRDRQTVTQGGLEFLVFLSVGAGRTALRVNNNELAILKAPSTAFSLSLHGGDNGTDFGVIEISGKPDADWFAELSE